jgi:hypothetical protein
MYKVISLIGLSLLLIGTGPCDWTPTPTPTPTPTVEPTPTPTPVPTPTPPVITSCPKPLAPEAEIYLNNKNYGNGLDSTLRVRNDPEFCRLIHGVVVNDCHLEGWSKRSACEMELMSGCPIWFYSTDGVKPTSQCFQNPHPIASCDHFGDPVDRDDPQTPQFEGKPTACGLQRDNRGDPMAGFFVIAHAEPGAKTYFRACLPDGSNCGPWILGKDN